MRVLRVLMRTIAGLWATAQNKNERVTFCLTLLVSFRMMPNRSGFQRKVKFLIFGISFKLGTTFNSKISAAKKTKPKFCDNNEHYNEVVRK
jgi:hypothetical protein